MGSLNIRSLRSHAESREVYARILRDLDAFEQMYREGSFERRGDRIGAEQELCLVDQNGRPSLKSPQLLSDLDDSHYTHELALFNLEINADPQEISKDGFGRMQQVLQDYLTRARKVAAYYDVDLYLGGILPTIKSCHLTFEHMTPLERYQVLNRRLLELRGSDFQIYLQGVDELMVTHDSDLFEACNTSFQGHLQIDPQQFVRRFNWAQMIAAPVLAVATNSPLLLGRELWSETRIALFKQSVDTRGMKDFTRVFRSRVDFGDQWIRESPAELWRSSIARFPLILQGQKEEDPHMVLQQGGIPKLMALQLFNGTTYLWNRLCYGINGPHLRIECRYLPAGPTLTDEMANLAFWAGLMLGQPDELESFWHHIDFRSARDNFTRAARTGIHSVFDWMGQRLTAQTLILDRLLPIAESGLIRNGVPAEEVSARLGVIEARTRSGQTGSEWLIKTSRRIRKKYHPSFACQQLVKLSLRYQKEDIPVHEWPIEKVTYRQPVLFTVENLMNSDINAINENLSIGLARHIMKWHGIHHLPVETQDRELSGILDWHDIENIVDHEIVSGHSRKPVLIDAQADLDSAAKKMELHNCNALLVMEEDRLAGILTKTDLVAVVL